MNSNQNAGAGTLHFVEAAPPCESVVCPRSVSIAPRSFGRLLGAFVSIIAMSSGSSAFAQTVDSAAESGNRPAHSTVMKGASPLALELLARREGGGMQENSDGIDATDTENETVPTDAPPPPQNDQFDIVLTGAVAANASYSSSGQSSSSFGGAQFVPILLVGYGNNLLFETQMEIATEKPKRFWNMRS